MSGKVYSDNMNILYVVSSLEKSGPNNVLLNIIKEVSINNKCSIITLSSENNKSMLSEFENCNIRIIQLNLNRNSNKKIYISNLNKIIKDITPDIIHSHGFRSDRYIKLINKNKSFDHVTTLHNFPFDDYPRLYGIFRGILLSIFHLYIIKSIKHKIACSYSIAKKYKMLHMNDISVIQNGVDTDEFKPISKIEKDNLRKSLGLPLDKKIVISTGALIRRKRPVKLIKAFRSGNWENKVLFIVLGDGKLFRKLEYYSNESIRILGLKKNISEYLQASDIFISNSKAEGLPMAMLEAAATGNTIVGSDIPPHKELRDLYLGKTILFNGQKTRTIINQINEALSEKECCSNISSDNLSSKIMANKYLAYYRNMKVKK